MMAGVRVPMYIFYMYIIHVLYTCYDCLFVWLFCLTCRCVLLFRMWVGLLFLIQLVCYTHSVHVL